MLRNPPLSVLQTGNLLVSRDKMSTTTITTTKSTRANTVVETTIGDALKDYTLHLSGATSNPAPPLDTEHDGEQDQHAQPSTVSNPSYWPTQHRRIPPYRPANRNLDLSERPNGSNRAELLFVTVMMNGVRLQSVRFVQSFDVQNSFRADKKLQRGSFVPGKRPVAFGTLG
jgi:hypothetical protein